MLVRIAALAAVDAPPVSYALNLEAAATSGSTPSRSAASSPRSRRSSAPSRVASATAAIVGALAIELEVAEMDSYDG